MIKSKYNPHGGMFEIILAFLLFLWIGIVNFTSNGVPAEIFFSAMILAFLLVIAGIIDRIDNGLRAAFAEDEDEGDES